MRIGEFDCGCDVVDELVIIGVGSVDAIIAAPLLCNSWHILHRKGCMVSLSCVYKSGTLENGGERRVKVHGGLFKTGVVPRL